MAVSPWAAADVEVAEPGRYLPSAFDVDGLAVGSVASMLRGAADLAEARALPRPALSLDAAHVACAFTSERQLRRDGAPPAAPFAPLSRFARTRDGWIRLHANYDHHRRALLAAVGVSEEDALAAIAQRGAEELEEAIVTAGGAAAAVRTPDEWAAHPQGGAVAELPLVERRTIPARRRHLGPLDPDLPAAGVRVLDLTRVIAGPVATRALAALGADVLRIDPPQLPELELGILDTCPGKRLAQLDLRDRQAAATLHGLLADADVLVHGYRPRALAAFGLGADELAERHPHLVVASLSAWGHTGPWAQRRGFDSLVQAACGIAAIEGADGEPGVLPAQALDHATGYLMAAAVLRELAAGDGAQLRFALSATAAELMRHPAQDAAAAIADCDRHRVALGEQSLIGPPGALDGRRLTWAHASRQSAPHWL